MDMLAMRTFNTIVLVRGHVTFLLFLDLAVAEDWLNEGFRWVANRRRLPYYSVQQQREELSF